MKIGQLLRKLSPFSSLGTRLGPPNYGGAFIRGGAYNRQNTVLLLFFVSADGFLGYNSVTLSNNTGPGYQSGETFFTVFGVFFPTATGVFAGINMSGDLQNPAKNIPLGTMSAVGVR